MPAKIPSEVRKRKVARLLKRDGACCFYCFARFSQAGPVTLDHRVPIAKGGSNVDANLVLSCVACNGWKGDKDEAVFLRSKRLAYRRARVEATLRAEAWAS